MPADLPSGPVAPGDAEGAAGRETVADQRDAATRENATSLAQCAAPGLNGSPVDAGNGSVPGITASPVTASPAAGTAPPGTAPPGTTRRGGRNLPAAIGVGLAMGAGAIITLFTVKATFLAYMGVAVALALWELFRALGSRDIKVPLAPVAAGGTAAVLLAYWVGERALVFAVALTVTVILAWRLAGPPAGYLRDVMAGVFAFAYLPLMACFVSLMLASSDGPQRTVVFLVVAVCSDVGGYSAGSLFGRHLMAPVISPKKTWEGFAGSAAACIAAGAITVPILLSEAVWQGVLVGAAGMATATLGDLVESAIKRDLALKDMGSLLPGHGGILDRIDSMLISAPVIWVLLAVFVRHPH